MSPDRLQLAKRNAEEVVTKEELKTLLETKSNPKAYWGFEPSGLMHTGCMVPAGKIKDMIDLGFEFTIFMADWHAYINDKLDGDMENIKVCGKYFEDCFI
ncbi:MAG: tyrosine--tRNA ligase, partial [Thermoplasmata archaeon]|nr:tyrosine--tRNA ligase [Thermoplasmata archaeon]